MITTKQYLELNEKLPFDSEYYNGIEEDKKDIIKYNKNLIKMYPWLKPINVGDKYDYSFTALDDMPNGWRLAFSEEMCKEINDELIKFNFVNKYSIMQIKEKYGSLRWYGSGYPIGNFSDVIKTAEFDEEDIPKSTDTENWKFVSVSENGKYKYELRQITEHCHLNDIIHKYEDMSSHICVVCGKEAKWESTGWILPFCDDCKIGDSDEYVPLNTPIKEEEEKSEPLSLDELQEIFLENYSK